MSAETRLAAFYGLRAAEEPADDPGHASASTRPSTAGPRLAPASVSSTSARNGAGSPHGCPQASRTRVSTSARRTSAKRPPPDSTSARSTSSDLAADGRAVVSVPSPYGWVEVYRELAGRHDPEGHLNAYTTPVLTNLAALAGFRVERRLGTSVRIPRTMRLVSTDSILARSRIYVLRSAERVVFAGREL